MDREKVISGLRCCLKEHEEGRCPDDCSYIDDEWREKGTGVCRDFEDDNMPVPTRMLVDALAVLKALDVTPEELERLKKCRHECKIDCLLKVHDEARDHHNALIDRAAAFIDNLITCLYAMEYHEIEFQLSYLKSLLLDGRTGDGNEDRST